MKQEFNQENPFYKRFDTDFGSTPFSKISNSHFEPAIRRGIERGQAAIKKICNNCEWPSFENTIVALEYAGEELDRVLNVFYPILSANTNDELMEISMRISPLISDYSTSITLNEPLWQRVKAIYYTRETLCLSSEQKMLLQNTYDFFVRNGAMLQGRDREEFRKITSRISELTTVFGQNVIKELNTYEIWLAKDDLQGLTSDLIEGAANSAMEKGRPEEYLFRLDQPTYMGFMKFSSRRDLRERFYRLYCGRNINGSYSNIEVLKEIASLRRKKARLLGYDTFADYRLVKTMAETKENVISLLRELTESYRPAQLREFEEIEKFASRIEGVPVKLQPWDYSYYAYKLKKEKYHYDEERLRPYFELGNTVKGVFGLATKLYGLDFEELHDIDLYHPDVKVYKVTEDNGQYLGLLYMDFFPCESKQPGAWMTEFRPQYRDMAGKDIRPHISIVTNFSKPTASKPSLLTPGEVRTLLHEFGHALHGLLSKCTFASLSGTNVYRDFVELPSQFNENFLTRGEFLEGFARHYETGENIPMEYIRQIIETSQFGAGYSCMRQLNFGLLDVAWHSITSEVEDVSEFEINAGKEVAVFPVIEGALVSPQFSHIFSGGYAASYYSYKWSEVLDADAFSAFEENGVFNKDTACSFRKNILEKGGSEHPAILYRRFRGRDAKIDALLVRDGLK